MLYGVEKACENVVNGVKTKNEYYCTGSQNLFCCEGFLPATGVGEYLKGGSIPGSAAARRLLFGNQIIGDYKANDSSKVPSLIIEKKRHLLLPSVDMFQKYYVWSPQEQFSVVLRCTCKHKEKEVKRINWKIGHVWGMDGICGLIVCNYQCTACKSCHLSSNMPELVKWGLPTHVISQCPIIFSHIERYTSKFFEWVVQCMDNGIRVDIIHRMMLQNMSKKYLKDMNIFHSHVEYYLSLSQIGQLHNGLC